VLRAAGNSGEGSMGRAGWPVTQISRCATSAKAWLHRAKRLVKMDWGCRRCRYSPSSLAILDSRILEYCAHATDCISSSAQTLRRGQAFLLFLAFPVGRKIWRPEPRPSSDVSPLDPGCPPSSSVRRTTTGGRHFGDTPLGSLSLVFVPVAICLKL